MQLPEVELQPNGGVQPESRFLLVVTPSFDAGYLQQLLDTFRIPGGESLALFAHVRRSGWLVPQGPSFSSFEDADVLLSTPSSHHTKVVDCDGSISFFESLSRAARGMKAQCIVVPQNALNDIARFGSFARAFLVPTSLKSTPQECLIAELVNLRVSGCGIYFPPMNSPSESEGLPLTIVLNLDRLLFFDCPPVIRFALHAIKPKSVSLLGFFSPPAITPPGMGSAGHGLSPEGDSWNEAFRTQRKNCQDLLNGFQKYIPTASTVHVCTVDEGNVKLNECVSNGFCVVAFQRHPSALLGNSSAARLRSYVWRDENERMLRACVATGKTSVLVAL
jgi:hypothetical protein